MLGGVIGGVSGRSSGGNSGGGALSGLSNQQHAHPHPNANEKLFILAVQNNDIGTAQEMLNAGVDINGVYTLREYSDDHLTAFAVALYNKNLDMMQFLLENGADVNGYYNYDNLHISYLEAATSTKYDMDINVVQFLLDWGADINGYTDNRMHSECRKTMALDCVTGANLLRGLASNIDIPVMQLLIERGAYLENRDDNGLTPFLRCIEWKSSQQAKILADAGANINAKDKKGRNALQIAIDTQDLQLYKEVQEIMAQGQQPSQYQPSGSQSQSSGRIGHGPGTLAESDELVNFENQSANAPEAREKEIRNFIQITQKANDEEKNVYSSWKDFAEKKSQMSDEERSANASKMLDTVEKIKSLLEPQKIMSSLTHCKPEEQEAFRDVIQLTNTKYDKFSSALRILTSEHALTQEEQEKVSALMNDTDTVNQNVAEAWGRIARLFEQDSQ